jgi:DNA-binding MarR family transcriptional regulator
MNGVAMPGQMSDELICSRIRRAEQALMAHHETVLRRFGLSMAQYTALLALSRESGQSAAQLARANGVTQQTMSTVLSGLLTKGLIERQPSAVHAKVQITSLTADGVQTIDAASDEVIALERTLSRRFSAKERQDLCDLLDRATAVLDEQTSTMREPN